MCNVRSHFFWNIRLMLNWYVILVMKFLHLTFGMYFCTLTFFYSDLYFFLVYLSFLTIFPTFIIHSRFSNTYELNYYLIYASEYFLQLMKMYIFILHYVKGNLLSEGITKMRSHQEVVVEC